MKTYSANDTILFRLTPEGRRIVERAKAEFVARCPGFDPQPIGPIEDADGTCRWHLWQVMAMFGPHTGWGRDCMIENVRFEEGGAS